MTASAQPAASPNVFRFSTDQLPEPDRLAMWREVFARSMVKVDFKPLGEGGFRSESEVYNLPDVAIRRSSATAAEVTRTKALVADGDDNMILTVMRRGQMHAEQGGREVFLDQGGAYLWSNAAVGVSTNPTSMDLMMLTFPRRSLAAAVGDLDAETMRLVPRQAEALGLLVGYVDMLRTADMASELKALASSHVHDLAALALGATREALHAAANGGVRAARLAAVKKDVLQHLLDPGLSLETVAARHGISPRYVRALFDRDLTSFTDFVREHRLRLAHLRLSDLANAHENISTIAYACGFGDLSYFNHAFRRRFGATPSDIRHAAFASGVSAQP